MNKSEVFFTNLRVKAQGDNLLKKVERLIKKAGIEKIDFEGKFTAIKMNFGEPGNLSYIRPNYAKVVCDVVKSLGGKPFLTDCNTLYVGRRKEALEHMDAAYENGFTPFSTGCHIIIADGIKGTDETIVKIDGELVKEAKIGTAIMDSDIFISISHFKGHESTGFGGALKNIGMGCGSRAGKMEMHSSGKPSVEENKCVSCKSCLKQCAHGAITLNDNVKAVINQDKCVGCGRCIGSCVFDAISAPWDAANDDLNKKIAEYSYAILKDKPHFHISLVIDISPYCDCHSENDAPIIPDVGIFASFDPVALDVACADACNRLEAYENSKLGEALKANPNCRGKDHFTNSFPDTDWKVCSHHAEKLGLGNIAYEIIEVI